MPKKEEKQLEPLTPQEKALIQELILKHKGLIPSNQISPQEHAQLLTDVKDTWDWLETQPETELKDFQRWVLQKLEAQLKIKKKGD